MGSGGKGKLRIPATEATTGVGKTRFLSPVERELIGIVGADQSSTTPSVSLKYYDPKFECFSAWSPEKLAAFSSFLGKLAGHTWNEVYRTGGKPGYKVGLGYTPHKDRGKLPSIPVGLSEDLTFFEMRVTQEARVHGFRVNSIFFLVWLDQGHRIYPA